MKQLTINQPLHGLPALSQVWAIPVTTDTYVLAEDFKLKNPRVIKTQHLAL